jgi:hypothetical protein
VLFEPGAARVDTLVWDSFSRRMSRLRSVYAQD